VKNIKLFEEYSRTPVKDFFKDKIDMKIVQHIEKVLTKYEDMGYQFDIDIMILETITCIYDIKNGEFYDAPDLNIDVLIGQYENYGLSYTIYCENKGIYKEIEKEFKDKYKEVGFIDNMNSDRLIASFFEDDEALLYIKK